MVCEKCQKKLGTVICPDVWKSGARNTMESGGRRVNENKILSSSKRFTPCSATCRVCKSKLIQQGIYCQACAYKKGVCSMCGKKILDISMYRQSTS